MFLQQPMFHSKIKGEFQAEIILNPPDKRKRDIDNFHKALLDFAQANGIIENDHLCQRLLVTYGEAPLGARMILTPHP